MFEVWFFIIDFVGGLYCSSDQFTLSQSNCTVWASNFLAVSSVFTITSFTGRSWSESAKFWPNESTSCSEDVRVVLLLLMTVISGSMGCSSALSLSLGLAIWTLFLLPRIVRRKTLTTWRENSGGSDLRWLLPQSWQESAQPQGRVVPSVEHSSHRHSWVPWVWCNWPP